MPLLYDELLRILEGSADASLLEHRVSEGRSERAKAEFLYQTQQLSKAEAAQVYLLDVRQAEHFKGAEFGFESFPPMVHKSIWVEFNGTLRFDYVPLMVEHTTFGKDFTPQVVRVSEKSHCSYRGVLIYEMTPPHLWNNLPEERVVRAFWYETPGERVRADKRAVYEEMDSFSVTLTPSVWPRMLHEDHYTRLSLAPMSPAGMAEVIGADAYTQMLTKQDAETGAKTLLHARRIQRMTTNLLYFLSAENVVKVRIRPEYHARYGKDLAGLPRSAHAYNVLPFQLPRYRYLNRDRGEPSGRTVSVRFDVRGHFRHLNSDRYDRNPDGSVRVVWVRPHERGVENPSWSKTRVGTIDGLFLDYDKFISEEEARHAQGS